MKLHDLIVMQQQLRHIECVPQMMEHVRCGGLWNREYLHSFAKKNNLRPSPLIQISKFNDGLFYLHDGHHRSVATRLGGRKEFYPEEYEIKTWTYEQYLNINFNIGFVTPFDPRTQCRKAELSHFKKKIRDIAKTNRGYAEELIWLAWKGLCPDEDFYWEPRVIRSVLDLVKLVAHDI